MVGFRSVCRGGLDLEKWRAVQRSGKGGVLKIRNQLEPEVAACRIYLQAG